MSYDPSMSAHFTVLSYEHHVISMSPVFADRTNATECSCAALSCHGRTARLGKNTTLKLASLLMYSVLHEDFETSKHLLLAQMLTVGIRCPK
jgi:hypothetical protein